MHFTVDTDLAIVGIVIGLIAVVIALPPLLQMVCGRPHLEFEAQEFMGPDGSKQLIIAIKNKMIENSLLRKIGVERVSGDITASFDIQEQGTGKFIQKDVSGLMHTPRTRETGLLARAFPGFTVGVVIVETKGAQTYIVDARSDGQFRSIEPGDYTVFAGIICGEEVRKIRRNFKVGTASHLTFWV
jgi:hypothetical protein